jgi:hypothetical protein
MSRRTATLSVSKDQNADTSQRRIIISNIFETFYDIIFLTPTFQTFLPPLVPPLKHLTFPFHQDMCSLISVLQLRYNKNKYSNQSLASSIQFTQSVCFRKIILIVLYPVLSSGSLYCLSHLTEALNRPWTLPPELFTLHCSFARVCVEHVIC